MTDDLISAMRHGNHHAPSGSSLCRRDHKYKTKQGRREDQSKFEEETKKLKTWLDLKFDGLYHRLGNLSFIT